ncbi:MAG: hypothetical protein Q8942_09680, partial [Bacillota bacterium]|nr:hypothetical protein [Bacillota bacterium]
ENEEIEMDSLLNTTEKNTDVQIENSNNLNSNVEEVENSNKLNSNVEMEESSNVTSNIEIEDSIIIATKVKKEHSVKRYKLKPKENKKTLLDINNNNREPSYQEKMYLKLFEKESSSVNDNVNIKSKSADFEKDQVSPQENQTLNLKEKEFDDVIELEIEDISIRNPYWDSKTKEYNIIS